MLYLTGALDGASYGEAEIMQSDRLLPLKNATVSNASVLTQTPTVPEQKNWISSLNSFATGFESVANAGVNIYESVNAVTQASKQISSTVPSQTLYYKEVDPLSSGEKAPQGSNVTFWPFKTNEINQSAQPGQTILQPQQTSINPNNIMLIAAVLGIAAFLFSKGK